MRVLLDEHGRPPLRTVIGALLAAAAEADIAVAHIRLGALDLHADELRGVRRCRILVGTLDSAAVALPPDGSPGTSPSPGGRYDALLEFVRSDHVQIRSAGVCAWAPDFSIYRGIRTGRVPAVCLIGAHYFREPPGAGPAFTWAGGDAAAVARASRRFDDIWARSYDVRAAVLQNMRRVAAGA